MAGPTISFCTYTYNDGEFAEELIRETREFTIVPDEIIVVDDGSDIPFAMENPPHNLRIIRFQVNSGITYAKGAGLSAAAGDFIFSMDCDTRVAPDWLERNLPHANMPNVGLTGGSLVYRSGNDLVSRYLAAFGDNHNQRHVGPVDFIPGNAFLLRRDTWDLSGGFNEYAETNCQDHYLCNRLVDMGYTLYSDARAKAWQLRRITRTTMCKRVWKWCHKPIKTQAAEADDIVTYLFGTLAAPMLDRCSDSNGLGEPLFYYLELLYLAHSVMDTLAYLAGRGLVSRELQGGFIVALAALFSGYPKIWAMFRADMYVLGHDVLSTIAEADGESWNEFFIFSAMFRDGGLLSWLNEQGVAQLIREEIEGSFDFSSYGAASFAM